MESLKKTSEAADGVSILIIGTENGIIHFLPPEAVDSNVICSIQLPSPPVILNVSGIFDVEWRVTVACRDGKLYSLKNGEVRGSALLTGRTLHFLCFFFLSFLSLYFSTSSLSFLSNFVQLCLLFYSSSFLLFLCTH